MRANRWKSYPCKASRHSRQDISRLSDHTGKQSLDCAQKSLAIFVFFFIFWVNSTTENLTLRVITGNKKKLGNTEAENDYNFKVD